MKHPPAFSPGRVGLAWLQPPEKGRTPPGGNGHPRLWQRAVTCRPEAARANSARWSHPRPTPGRKPAPWLNPGFLREPNGPG